MPRVFFPLALLLLAACGSATPPTDASWADVPVSPSQPEVARWQRHRVIGTDLIVWLPNSWRVETPDPSTRLKATGPGGKSLDFSFSRQSAAQSLDALAVELESRLAGPVDRINVRGSGVRTLIVKNFMEFPVGRVAELRYVMEGPIDLAFVTYAIQRADEAFVILMVGPLKSEIEDLGVFREIILRLRWAD